jgi:membrane-bound lytic murein transglycosylase F
MTPRVQAWRPQIEVALQREWPEAPIGWQWIAAHVAVESGGDPEARGVAGELGLLQVMPGTASEIGLALTPESEPTLQLQAGIRYLKRQYLALTSPTLALPDRLCWAAAAYNGGPGYTRIALARVVRDLGPAAARWDVGRYWLMHPTVQAQGRRPDYLSIWGYVARVVREAAT